jgi:tetratricopeptide (TPR) repeat protein
MKSPTPRLLSWIVLALVAGGVSACGTAESRRAQALEKGQHYLDAGNLEKARVEFLNALQISPNDAEARYRNGLVQERLGNPREAGGFFQGAVAVNPDHAGARTELARMYLVAGLPEKTLEVLKPGLEKHPDDALMLALRAAGRVRLQDAEGATTDAEKAYALNPRDESVIAVLAGIYSSQGGFDKARGVLEQGVKDHPASADLQATLADFYMTTRDTAKAEATLRGLVTLKPDVAAHRIRLAQFLSADGQDGAAEVVLRDALAALPRDRSLQGALVSFLVAKKGREAAEAELVKMAARGGDAAAQFALAQLYAEGGDPTKAATVLRDVIRAEGTRPAGLEARTRLALLENSRGDRSAAAKLVAEVLAHSPRDAAALELRAGLELADDDPKDAIVDLRAVLRDQPSSAAVLTALARAHVQSGEPALAEESLRQAMDANPKNADVRYDLATFLIQQGRPVQAKEIVAPIAKERPADARAQTALFRASVAAKDYATARVAAERLLAADPRSPIGHYFLGLIVEQEGRLDAALGEYDAALELQPDGTEPLEAMTRMLAAHKRVPDALKRLDDSAARAPTVALPLSLKGEVLLGEKRYAEAEAAFRAASARAPKWWLPYRNLALVEFAKGERAAAFATLTAAVSLVDDPNRLRAQIASAHEAAGEWDDAIRAYDAILTAAPKDRAAANNLAMLLANHRSDAASLARAGELVKPFAGSPNANFLDTYGWVTLKHGDANAALAALEKAQAAAPASPELRYHLAMAQLAAGQRNKATDNLRQAVASPQVFPGRGDAKSALDKLGGA